jgi:superoxide reductase
MIHNREEIKMLNAHLARLARFAAMGGSVVGLVTLLGLPRFSSAGQEEQFTPEYRELRTSFDAKHTPKIVAPDSVKRGEWFDVTVSVGSGGDHPSLTEHFVRYIALYLDTAEIARVYLHPVYSFPKVTFTIALDQSGMLRAIEEPTHSAAWESSKKITVAP